MNRRNFCLLTTVFCFAALAAALLTAVAPAFAQTSVAEIARMAVPKSP